MITSVVIRPEAESDILEAAEWYATERAELADRFLDAVEAAVRAVLDNPRRFPRLRGDVRRALMPRFPYGMYFRAETERLHVLAVLHLQRDPGAWRRRH